MGRGMMNKTIMFIGAGEYQLPGINKAKEMGLRVVAIDYDRNAPGLKVADVPVALDVKDIEGAIKIAKENKIDGVLTIASDIAVPTVAAVADELGLPGISPEVAKIATNKALMREKFVEHGVPSPRFRNVRTLVEAKEAAEEIGFPVVVKPVDNAGSRGVTKIDKMRGIKGAYLSAKEFSREGSLLIEKFMNGEEVAVDAFIYKKKMHAMVVSDKIRTPPPYLLDTTVIFPSNYSDDIINEVCKIAMNASVYAAGIDNSPIHVEIMMTPEGPKMVELAARGAGFKVYTDILPLVNGVDTLDATIKISLDMEPDLSVKTKRAAVLKFFQNRPGKLKAIRGLDEAKKLKGVVDLEIYVKPGDIIKPLTCGSDRIGHVITLADTRKDAVALVEQVGELIDFEIEIQSVQ